MRNGIEVRRQRSEDERWKTDERRWRIEGRGQKADAGCLLLISETEVEIFEPAGGLSLQLACGLATGDKMFHVEPR